ncbi:hypothetical protein Pint_18612 [Pistacia integerrima]|uniref:Uncharacterized protein n=1 Tax=Pistacia integerrima TaxID=434235 RepID=A0ACC0YVW5_9ROSI|nr:hypothetical protein Pint_18612 [Pistacia integerrima]
MEIPLGVRKGAWTEEEDNLLRKCIEKYGEEKWHQIPLRAEDNSLCQPSTTLDPQDSESVWWENVLSGKEFDQGASSSSGRQKEEVMPMANLLEENSSPGTTKGEEYNIFYEVGQTLPTDLWLDVNLWNLFNTEQQKFI